MISEMDAFIAGKLSALEFLVEVMMANSLVTVPAEEVERFFRDLLQRPGYTKTQMEADEMEAVSRECDKSLANVLEKVKLRLESIRQEMAAAETVAT